MIAVNGAVKTLIDKKVRRRTLLTELRAQPLFQFLQFVPRKAGVEEHVDNKANQESKLSLRPEALSAT